MSAAGFSRCCDDVALGDAAILAGAGDGSGVDLVLRPPSCARPATAACSALAAAGAGSGFRTGASAGFAATPPAAPSSIEPRSAPTLTVLPAAASIARELARRRRRHFHRHLVGFEFHQRLVGLHRFAGLLEPLGNRRLGDRFTESRNADFLRHLVCPLCLAVAEGIVEECLQFPEMLAHQVPLRWMPMRPGRHSGRARSWRR